MGIPKLREATYHRGGMAPANGHPTMRAHREVQRTTPPGAVAFSTALVLVVAVTGLARAQDNPGASPSPPPMPDLTPPAPPPAPPGVRSMTLDEALRFARAQSPVILTAEARIRQREAEAAIPRAQWYPTAGGTAMAIAATVNNTSAAYVGTPDVDIPRVALTENRTDPGQANWTPYPTTLVGVGARQELFDFGRIHAQSAVADAAIDVERQRGTVDALDVDYGVRVAYYGVNAARDIVQAAEDAYRREVAQRELVQAWVTQGLRPRIDLDRADADLARFDVQRIRANGDLAVARAAFAAAVGVPEPLLDATPQPLQTSYPATISDALARAAVQDPLLREYLARIHQQSLLTHAIASEARPNVSLTAALTATAGGAPVGTPSQTVVGDGFLPIIPNWDVGLLVSWPIFDATVWARHRASQRAEEALRAQLGVIRQALTAAVQEAWIAVDEAQRAVPALQRAVDAARANYDQAVARYRSGLGNAVELADAEALRVDAEVQLAVGRLAVERAAARLIRVVAEGH